VTVEGLFAAVSIDLAKSTHAFRASTSSRCQSRRNDSGSGRSSEMIEEIRPEPSSTFNKIEICGVRRCHQNVHFMDVLNFNRSGSGPSNIRSKGDRIDIRWMLYKNPCGLSDSRLNRHLWNRSTLIPVGGQTSIANGSRPPLLVFDHKGDRERLAR